MAQSPRFPSVPVPLNNVDALYHTCVALKQAVEHMQGVDRHGLKGARIFVQDSAPVSFDDGNFWLAASSLSVAKAGQWYLIGTLS